MDVTPGGTYKGVAPLADADIRLVTRAVLDLMVAVEKLSFDCLDNEPPKTSLASQFFYAAGASKRTMDGFLLMQYGHISSFDHIRALIAAIRAPTPRSTSLATLTRGALEGLSRSWHLCTSPTLEDFQFRTLSMLHSDLRFAARNNEPISTRDGDPLDAVTRRQQYSDELLANGLPGPQAFEVSSKVAEMLDSELGDSSGKSHYSTLSSVAHAHMFAVNAFVATDLVTGGVAGLVAPRPIVEHFAFLLLVGLSAAAEPLVEMFGNQPAQQDRLQAATRRSFEAYGALAGFDVAHPDLRHTKG